MLCMGRGILVELFSLTDLSVVVDNSKYRIARIWSCAPKVNYFPLLHSNDYHTCRRYSMFMADSTELCFTILYK